MKLVGLRLSPSVDILLDVDWKFDRLVGNSRGVHRAYHFYIDINGKIWKGRDVDRTGAHCKNHNRNSIGVCYCGGVEADGKTPKDTRTEAQKESLLHVLKTLMAMFPLATIYSHNEFANKACPSFDATNEYKDL